MKKINLIWIIIVTILAIAVIIGAVILSYSNRSNENIQNKAQNPISTNTSEMCKVQGNNCFETSDCCADMFCCRPQGFSEGYCSSSCEIVI